MYFGQKTPKCNENHILKRLTFTLIMLSSIQTVEIPQKLTFFFNNSCRNFKSLRGTGKNDEKVGFKSIKICFHTDKIQFYQLELLSMTGVSYIKSCFMIT